MPSESLLRHFCKGLQNARQNQLSNKKMGVETGNYELAAKRFENTFRAMGFRDFRSSRSKSTGGAFKGPYKSGSSLMTCEAELHGSVTRMASSILSLMGSHTPYVSHRPRFIHL